MADVKPMPLSQAIRLGAMMRPQCVGGWMDGDGACALSAAAMAVGIEPVMFLIDQRLIVDYCAIRRRWPVLDLRVPGPVDGFEAPVYELIYDLNDYFGWSRERIADWVEQIEQQQEAQASQPSEAVEVTA